MNTLDLLGELEAKGHLDRFIIRRRHLAVKHLRPLVEAVQTWRADAYPCWASTCRCVDKWHMRVGPTPALIESTDKALAALHKDLEAALKEVHSDY